MAKGGIVIKSNVHSKYRWIVLISMIPIIVSIEMMWLSLAPISSLAESYYGVGSLSIALCSMSFMLMFILFSFPASWVIDRYGYRTSLIIGASLTAIFGLLRAVFADDFTIVLITQFIIAIAQPFLLNLSTKAAADWFPVTERSTAAGLLTLAQYVGFIVPVVVAPIVAEQSGIPQLFMLFAIIAIVSACIAILFAFVKSPASTGEALPTATAMNLSTVKQLINNRAYGRILLISFISIGIFNTILTLLENIMLPRGITTDEASIIGAIFIVAGIIGAILLPLYSDKRRLRVPFFITAIAVLLPTYLALALANNVIWLIISAGIAGFAIMGVAPILFQHGSETAYPVQEGMSLGVILLGGQVSGTAFVYLFEKSTDAFGSILPAMLVFVVLTAALLPSAFRIKESSISG